MEVMVYEIEVLDYGKDFWHESTLSTLTGLPFDEVHNTVLKMNKKCWGGQLYIKAFQSLGFNTNLRFVKFDKDTPYPCILRCCNHTKGYWYLFYYNAGIVYDAAGYSFSLDDPTQVRQTKGSYFLKNYGMKVTSMLQVWI